MSGYALLFPGQGAQEPGMGRDLAAHFEAARDMFADADRSLGYSLSSACFEGDAAQLAKTQIAQPAIATVGLAALAALQSAVDLPLAPRAVAGHSLGEYTAVIAAGALGTEEGLRLIAERGRLMQVAADQRSGAMAAIIGLECAQLADLCRAGSGSGVCVVANENSAQQQVISGDPDAVERVGALARAAGAKRVIPLSVGGAFHSEHMLPASRGLGGALGTADFRDCRWPIIGNVDCAWLLDSASIRSELAAQLTATVRWRGAMESACRAGIELFIELGPGNVLSGLARRIVPDATAIPAGDSAGIARAADAILRLGTSA
jgi:[acyl-carrier-protein] S-malonyltransferase